MPNLVEQRESDANASSACAVLEQVASHAPWEPTVYIHPAHLWDLKRCYMHGHRNSLRRSHRVGHRERAHQH